MSDTTETSGFTGATYTIYVPPDPQPSAAWGGESRRTCVRIGAADTTDSGDEVMTYSAVRDGDAMFALPSTADYQSLWAGNGVTMLTTGWISLYARLGVSQSASETNIQTAGNAYTVTVDPKNNYEVVSASLANTSDSRWVTSSFTQASTIAVNDNYTATFGLGAAYSLASGLSLSNAVSLSYSSVVGAAVSSALALAVNIGSSSVSSTWPFGDTVSYVDEASQTAGKFEFLVDSPITNPALKTLDTAQKLFAKVASAASIVCDLAATAYAGTAMGVANQGGDTSNPDPTDSSQGLFDGTRAFTMRPQHMKGFLLAAEPIAITVTAVNALIGALGAVLGIIQLVASKIPTLSGTKLAIGDHTIFATTGVAATATGTTTMTLDGTKGFDVEVAKTQIKLGVGVVPAVAASPTSTPPVVGVPAVPGVTLTLDTSAATLATAGATIKATLDTVTIASGLNTIVVGPTGVTITSGTNSLAVTATGVSLNGTTIELNSPSTSFSAAPKMPGKPILPPPPLPTTPPPPTRTAPRLNVKLKQD